MWLAEETSSSEFLEDVVGADAIRVEAASLILMHLKTVSGLGGGECGILCGGRIDRSVVEIRMGQWIVRMVRRPAGTGDV